MSTEIEVLPRVYLNRVHLKGFKSIEDLTIDFQKGLNILIGKNGSGKSNFMEFIYQTNRRVSAKVLFNYANMEFATTDQHIFTFYFERILNHVNLDRNGSDERLNLFEKFEVDGVVQFDNSNENYEDLFRFRGKETIYRNSLRGLFRVMGYDTFNQTYIKFNLPNKHWDCILVPGTLKIDLEDKFTIWNYPDTLGFIDDIFLNIELFYDDSPDKIKKEIEFSFYEKLSIDNDILNNLQRFTTIENIRFTKNINIYATDKSIIIENIKIEFKVNGNWLPWSQLSDGTKRIFYIITEVSRAKGLILIEEPELGIHPHQFNLLMDFLKEQSADKQIILSTHSPKALDHLSPDELDHILIAYYDLEKGTQIRHLSDKEIKKAQKYMKEVGFFSDYWMLSDLE